MAKKVKKVKKARVVATCAVLTKATDSPRRILVETVSMTGGGLATVKDTLWLVDAADDVLQRLRYFVPVLDDLKTAYRATCTGANVFAFRRLGYKVERLSTTLRKHMHPRQDIHPDWLDCSDPGEVPAVFHGELTTWQNIAVCGLWQVVETLRLWFDQHTPAGPTVSEVPANLLDHFEAAIHVLRMETQREGDEDPVEVDIGKGRITVDGDPHRASAHHCQMVAALIEAEGHCVTGPQMNELPGCHGKKISREITNLEEAIPALEEYISHDGNKGYRILQ